MIHKQLIEQLIAKAAFALSDKCIGKPLQNRIIEFSVKDQKYTFPESKINIKTEVL